MLFLGSGTDLGDSSRLCKKCYTFEVLMRLKLAISFLLSKNIQLFVKKKLSLLYPDRGIYIPRSVPFSSLYKVNIELCHA